jgi:histidinol dehydrogenase
MRIEIRNWHQLDDRSRAALLQRPAVTEDATVREQVQKIVTAVRDGGDAALRRYTKKLDHADLEQARVSDDEVAAARSVLDDAAIAAIDLSIANVRRFHEAQLRADISVETMPGVTCEQVSRPIDAVGLYVPAGTAPLPSAAVMLAVPAQIAGCPTRVLCTPPRPDGTADPAVIIAATRAGITDIFKAGGAQAVAAMAYGTASIPKVAKIFGPGNAWVTCAKTVVAADPDGAAIDMPAGPSEVLVIADEAASPEFVASDLLSQAEHGVDSQVVLVTTSEAMARAALREIEDQLGSLSRSEIAKGSLEHARAVVVDSLETAVAVSNAYAPEHLILQCENARGLLPAISNAGSVFVGPWTPESVGDYCSGTNHVLPTYGHARNYSGLGIAQFMRSMTVQELTRDGLAGLADAVVELAGLEGLDAHAAAVTRRLKSPA